MRALVTGITGQIGSYLAEELRKRGHGVYGMVRGQDNPKIPELNRRLPSVRLVQGDLLDYASLLAVLDKVKPDYIFNLAAVSFVPISWEQPELVFQVNAVGPMRLLDAARARKLPIKIYQASTSEMFGSAPPPQNEETCMIPESPYAVSKLAAHRMCRVYRKSFGMQIYCGICFNTESVERPPLFVTRKITKAAARIKCGLQRELVMGNLDARRDWQWAGDAATAMVDMLEKAEPDDYVISSGISHSVKDFLEIAFGYLGLDYREFVSSSPDHMRPVDTNDLCGDSLKLREAAHWRPRVRFNELVKLMVDFDLAAAKAEASAQRVNNL